MRRLSLLQALLFALGGCAAGTQYLFDGSSLAGWTETGAAQWTARAGLVVGEGKQDGFIYTLDQFENFDLFLEFWIDAGTNSGVFVRCIDAANINPNTCLEMNIFDQHPNQQARTGAIVGRVMPPLVRVESVGKWNTYQVTAVDALLTVRVNGKITAILTSAPRRPGFIALQHWGEGTVKFRNLRMNPVAKGG